MAITESAWFGYGIEECMDASTGYDLDLDTHKMAIYNDSATPDFNESVAAYNVGSMTNTNEVANSTGWPTGGVALAATTWAAATRVAKLDGTDYSQADTTFTSGMAGLLYADAAGPTVTDLAILLVDFVSAVSPSAGTFTITFHADGVGTITY